MQNDQQSSTARLAALVALIAAFVVVVVVVVSSLAGSDSDEPAQRQGAGQGKQAGQQPDAEERKVYVVKPGDCCLSQIAEKTGVDVDTLIELNPNLDPQAIHSGDRVKLR
jgi:LysM repeat protein